MIEPDPGMGPGEPAWRGDLNGDGLDDLVLRFPDACGNYGDCPHAIYVACGQGRDGAYGSVWEPAYSFDLAVDEDETASETGWLTLLDTQRDGKEATVRRLAFTGERYSIVEVLEDP